MINKNLKVTCLLLAALSFNVSAQKKATKQPYSAYLFAYFTGNSKNEEAVHFA
jgi:hypothetical protein